MSPTLSGMTNEEEFAQLMESTGNVVIATDYNNQFCIQEVKRFEIWYKDIDISQAGTYL
jgi:hypothetical protein